MRNALISAALGWRASTAQERHGAVVGSRDFPVPALSLAPLPGLESPGHRWLSPPLRLCKTVRCARCKAGARPSLSRVSSGTPIDLIEKVVEVVRRRLFRSRAVFSGTFRHPALEVE